MLHCYLSQLLFWFVSLKFTSLLLSLLLGFDQIHSWQLANCWDLPSKSSTMYCSKQVVLKLQSIKLFDSTKRGSKAVSTSSGSGGSGWWQEGSALTRAHPTLLSCSELQCSSALVLTLLSCLVQSSCALVLQCSPNSPTGSNLTSLYCSATYNSLLIRIEHHEHHILC